MQTKAKGKKKVSQRVVKKYIFVATALAYPGLLFFVFFCGTSFGSILMSFQKIDFAGNATWNGLENFKTFIKFFFGADDRITIGVKNALILYGMSLIMLPFNLLQAYLIFKKCWGHAVMRALIMIPSIVSSLLMGRMDEYILSKLLWDPNRDVNQLTAEFCYYYFGDEADDEVMRFITFFDEYYRVAEETSNRKFFFEQVQGYTYHKLEYLDFALDLLKEAKEQVNASTSYSATEKQTYCKRLDMVRLTPLYMRMYNGTQYFQDNKEKKQEAVNTFFDLCYELGISYYGENRSIFSLYETYGYQEK